LNKIQRIPKFSIISIMKRALLSFVIVLLVRLAGFGQESVSTARSFISLLSEAQKTESVFPFDVEERYNFHFVPMKRRGITFNEMNPEQHKLALELLRSCLSEETFQKTREIMQLEVVLKELEKRKPEDNYRDPGNYHFSIFGNPSSNKHLGLAF
jgi:hypothetical protein